MFNWQEFNQHAHKMLAYQSRTTIPVAYLRSAISRAYYYAYHLSLEYAENRLGHSMQTEKNRNPRKYTRMGSHQALITYLKNEPDTNIILLGAKLEGCKKARVDADYEDSPLPPINLRRAQRVFIEVGKIEHLIPTLP
jgi:hypothetical protein